MKNRSLILLVGIGLIIGVTYSFGLFSFQNKTEGKKQVRTAAKEDVPPAASTIESAPLPVVASRPEKIKKTTTLGDTEEVYQHIDNNSRAYDSLLAVMQEEELARIENDPVLHDEMIALKEIALINKTTPKKNNAADTVIASKINLREESVPPAYTLEVWKSPLNSMGYRMGKNKLALYGVDPETDLLLILLDEGMFLKSGNFYYMIEKSAEFRNLRRISDTSVIRKLEN